MGTNDPKPTAASPADVVPIGKVAAWTLPWVLLLVVLLCLGTYTTVEIPFALYTWARRAAAIVLVVLAIIGLLLALEVVGAKEQAPWYTMGLLVALVLFWGLFPPAWFFTEYYLFDQGTFALPDEIKETMKAAVDRKAAGDIRAGYLATIKAYADLAAKVWVAVGAALATAIGLARR